MGDDLFKLIFDIIFNFQNFARREKRRGEYLILSAVPGGVVFGQTVVIHSISIIKSTCCVRPDVTKNFLQAQIISFISSATWRTCTRSPVCSPGRRPAIAPLPGVAGAGAEEGNIPRASRKISGN
ncbi:MAG: hypothetical protein HUU32_03705 [Calditrichaceae bacterium]|nr:hypothetical protein [Calditrichaceae bacterium]